MTWTLYIKMWAICLYKKCKVHVIWLVFLGLNIFPWGISSCLLSSCISFPESCYHFKKNILIIYLLKNVTLESSRNSMRPAKAWVSVCTSTPFSLSMIRFLLESLSNCWPSTDRSGLLCLEQYTVHLKWLVLRNNYFLTDRGH